MPGENSDSSAQMSKLRDKKYFLDVLDNIVGVVLLLYSLDLHTSWKGSASVSNWVLLINWASIQYAILFSLMRLWFNQKCCVFFFSGLIPRLLGDVLSLWICNLLAHLINTYAIDDSVIPSSFTMLVLLVCVLWRGSVEGLAHHETVL